MTRTLPTIMSAVEYTVQARLEEEAATQGYELPKGFMDNLSRKTVHIQEAAQQVSASYPDMLTARLAFNDDVRHFSNLVEVMAYTIINQ